MTAVTPDPDELLRRLVPITGTFNFRDLGGYATADGGTTRWGRLFRSDALHNVDAGAAPLVEALGLRTIVDLRSPAEREARPNALDGVLAVPCPVLDAARIDAAVEVPTSLGEIYDRMVDECGPAIAQAVKVLARPGALPAVLHCAAGKDRTGVVVGMLLSSLGVPDDVVALDFATTALCMTDEFAAVLAAGHPDGLDPAMLGADAELMHGLLGRLEAEHGGARAYLDAHGVTAEDHAQLRRQLVAGPGEPIGPEPIYAASAAMDRA